MDPNLLAARARTVTPLNERGGLGREASPVRALAPTPQASRDPEWLGGGDNAATLVRLIEDDVRKWVSRRFAVTPPSSRSDQGDRPLQVISILIFPGEVDPSQDGLTQLAGRIRNAVADGEAATSRPALHFGVLCVDKDAHVVTVCGKPIPLTSLELRLLWTLVGRADRVQSRTALLNDVWEFNDGVHTRTVDTHVKRLRDKLGGVGRAIDTVRGVGYRFNSSAACLTGANVVADAGEDHALPGE